MGKVIISICNFFLNFETVVRHASICLGLIGLNYFLTLQTPELH